MGRASLAHFLPRVVAYAHADTQTPVDGRRPARPSGRRQPIRGHRRRVVRDACAVVGASTRGCGVIRIIAAYLEREPYADVLLAPADVSFSRTRIVQPDVFVVPLVDGRRPRKFEDVGRLLLAVEILSPSTARADRVAKRVLFHDEGVREYWVVDLDARAFERSTPADARVDIIVDRLEWTVDGASAPLVVDVPEYFARVLDG